MIGLEKSPGPNTNLHIYTSCIIVMFQGFGQTLVILRVHDPLLDYWYLFGFWLDEK